MIDTKGLRIGNKVTERNNHRIYEVKNVLLNSVVVKYWSCGETEEISCNRLIGIPLTPEILEQCGFVGRFLIIQGSPLYFYLEDNEHVYLECHLTVPEPFDLTITENLMLVDYLHQLQNLYFALTGEELKINLHVESVNGRK